MRRFLSIWLLAAFLALPFSPSIARGAGTSLTFSPSSKTVTVEDEFTVKLLLNASQPVNASEATVHFSKSLLNVKSVSKSGSIFSIWAENPAFSNANGTVTYSGGLPSPGVNGSGKTILTITFVAEKTGTASLSLSDGSVLANDGLGTEVLTGTGAASITIQQKASQPEQPPAETPTTKSAPRISSSTHTDPNAWYPQRDVAISWSAGSGVTGYSVVFDDQEFTVPPEQNQGLANSLTQTVGEGTWYVHARALYGTEWTATTHFAVHVDATAPDAIVAELHRADEKSRSGSATFSSSDALSGIDRFEVALDSAAATVATSPFQFTDVSSGDHTIVITAFDKAGNAQKTELTFSVTTEALSSPTFLGRGQSIAGDTSDVPFIVLGDSLQLHGYAPSDATMRFIVRSEESVFTFPVADIADKNPVDPAPPGMTAWKVELKPDLAPGDHEVEVQTVDATGAVTAEAPIIKFRVLTNIAKIGGYFVTFQLIVVILVIIAVLGLGGTLFLIVLYVRLRRKRFSENKQL